LHDPRRFVWLSRFSSPRKPPGRVPRGLSHRSVWTWPCLLSCGTARSGAERQRPRFSARLIAPSRCPAPLRTANTVGRATRLPYRDGCRPARVARPTSLAVPEAPSDTAPADRPGRPGHSRPRPTGDQPLAAAPGTANTVGRATPVAAVHDAGWATVMRVGRLQHRHRPATITVGESRRFCSRCPDSPLKWAGRCVRSMRSR
jgi:hypothetical protein